jgi:Protein of unknown function (DUF4019)
MKINLYAVSFTCLSLAGGLVAGCGAKSSSANEKAGIAAAQAWVGLIDEGQYAESWNEAAPVFQGAVPEQKWADSLNKVRKPLGSLVSRNLKSTQEVGHMSGAPDGKYVVMQFDTSFANKQSAIETVTVGPEEDGQWKASGYYIK